VIDYFGIALAFHNSQFCILVFAGQINFNHVRYHYMVTKIRMMKLFSVLHYFLFVCELTYFIHVQISVIYGLKIMVEEDIIVDTELFTL